METVEGAAPAVAQTRTLAETAGLAVWKRYRGFEVEISRWQVLRLVLVNTVLTLLTLGIYRFWARTRLRQLIWRSVLLEGDPLEYTGTGRELFVGFLIAIVVLLPVLVVINVAQALIPPTDFVALGVFYLLLMLGAGLLGYLARFFARRYLLTRTRWRGIQAGQDAPLKGWMVLHMKTWAMNLLTLGLLNPIASVREYVYAMRHTRFGTARFDAQPDSSVLWAAWIPVWVTLLATIFFYLLFFIPYFVFGQEVKAAQDAGLALPSPPKPSMWGLLFIPAWLITWILHLRFQVIRFRHFAETTILPGIRFYSLLTPGQVFGPIAVILLWSLISLVVAGAAVAGIMVSLGSDDPKMAPLIGVVVILVYFIMMQIGLTVFFWVSVLRRVLGSLEIEGVEAADAIMNRADIAPRRGEGLADAIGDVGF